MNLATETCKTDCHDMAEILLKVALNPIQSINQSNITLLGTDSFISVISACYNIVDCFIYISRNKSGIWGWRSDRTETVNTHDSKVRPFFFKTEMIFFSYLTDFSYFFLKFFITKVVGHDLNRSKMEGLKGGVDGFSYFN